jgi:hypothetical protein
MADEVFIKPSVLEEAITSKRFLAASRAHASIGEIATWDRSLVRELRLLVPIDVQALYVGPGTAEPMVRIPLLLSEPDAVEPDEAMPPLFDAGTPRQPGVHLHWAMPDALMRGRLTEQPDGTANRLGLPQLPDRWVVLRILMENGRSRPQVGGWVLEADRAAAIRLADWSPGSDASNNATPTGVTLAAGELTGTVGGSAVWAGVYDAVGNRFAFHDPLDDLAEVAPNGVHGDAVAYVVAGWYQDPAKDPIDSARGADSLAELLDSLRWRLLPDWGDARYLEEYNESLDAQRGPLGLEVDGRFNRSIALRTEAPGAPAGEVFTPVAHVLTEENTVVASSFYATDAVLQYFTTPWHLRASLMHGAVYGVPVSSTPQADRRPTAGVRLALGEHDGDVLAALASVPGTPEDRRLDTERLLDAFAAQRINRIGTAEGIAEIDEFEHARAFTSLPAGSAGTDRFVQTAEPGRAGGNLLGTSVRETGGIGPILANQTPRATRAARSPRDAAAQRAAAPGFDAEISYAFEKHDLVVATIADIYAHQWQRLPITLPPTEARVVDRPAIRHTFPNDPMIAVQGAGRSLRHANDGRSSPDGKLTCRWPTQVVAEDQGVISGAELITTLGNGSIPPEVLSLAREVAIHDPYHTAWLAAAAAPKFGATTPTQIGVIERRLLAEAAIRFGADATYDGSTAVFTSIGTTQPPAAGRRRGAAAQPMAQPSITATQIADKVHSFSIVKGADPDPVGVTCWSQPWIPLWLEWEVELTGPAVPAIDGWTLGSVDLEGASDHDTSTTRTLQGRALLTTGAATTLKSAVDDWLTAENAREAADPLAGQADEATEAALAALAAAVTQADVVTAALDGLRTQLLGLPYGDGVRRTVNPDGTLADPVPVAPPVLLEVGALRFTRARLLDAFGRTLDLPVDAATVTVKDEVEGVPAALSVPPRLTRPARWQFRLVDAATLTGTDGIEARVDQVDPTLQVSPVAGFLLPDHLDESLEVFGADGAPLGELLHEPVGGGVVWEIAPGREGPPDAGPRHGLTPTQQPLGSFAAGLVAADAAHRAGRPAGDESALAALLRAIDTTLWTIDTFAGYGSEHVAGLVGRPIAVARAQLRLELRAPEGIDLSDPARQAEWDAAERELEAVAFPVRIGELTRTDDGVLGFFVDDDFTRFRPVDKAVAELARDAGRSRGQLGLLNPGEPLPPALVIDHPYVVGEPGTELGDSDTLFLHLGQTVTLTILLHPAGKMFLSSGILPRTSFSLARDWVAPGLARIAPALRTGPVLVETDLALEGQVRLPKVSVFGTDQDFWYRDTPGSWRSDAILAATQTALLPDTPAELRDGWIRVRPTPEGTETAEGGS